VSLTKGHDEVRSPCSHCGWRQIWYSCAWQLLSMLWYMQVLTCLYPPPFHLPVTTSIRQAALQAWTTFSPRLNWLTSHR
jgi:hypothetical protein